MSECGCHYTDCYKCLEQQFDSLLKNYNQLESLKEDCEKIYQQNDILSQQIETLKETNQRLKNACNWLIGNQILNVDKYFIDNLRIRTEKQFNIDLTEE